MPADGVEKADLQISLVEGLDQIDRQDWDSVANAPGLSFDPFLSWDFLEALERSGCASPKSGWGPRHLVAHNAAGELVAAAPLYLKGHSRGEFVFDHSWADALHNAGGQYYPKLLCAVPFTPVTGRRILVRQGPDESEARQAVLSAMIDIARRAGVSSLHLNFLDEASQDAVGRQGLLLRYDQQFHWINRGYATFSEFLSALSSRKRKMIRKEREYAQRGLRIERLTGDALTDAHWDAFFNFYMDTGGRKWGSPYLNRAFFRLLHERMPERCLLVMAFDGEQPIAGALNLIGSEALYGRYWGRSENRPFLHFEVCYYQAIEHAIERGLARVEAGAQGEHKLTRGYEPALTVSGHWIAHPGLRGAVANYLERERPAVLRGIEELSTYAPFRRNLDGSEVGVAEQDEETF